MTRNSGTLLLMAVAGVLGTVLSAPSGEGLSKTAPQLAQKEVEKNAAPLSSREKLRQEILRAGRVQEFPPMAWAKAIVKDTPHYRIVTNTSEMTSRYLMVLMEQLYQFYGQRMGKYPTRKMDVSIFATRKDFCEGAAAAGHGVGAGVAGFYSPGSGIYLPWVVQGNMEPASVLMHEGWHQFFYTVFMGGEPIWLNEGMAVYFENCRFDGENLTDAYISPTRLVHLQQNLKAGTHDSLPQLLRIPHGAFRFPQYGEAWSFIYWLAWGQGSRAKNEEMQRRFVAYIDYLKQKRDTSAAGFEKATALKLQDLEPAWKQWVLTLDPKDPYGGKGDPHKFK